MSLYLLSVTHGLRNLSVKLIWIVMRGFKYTSLNRHMSSLEASSSSVRQHLSLLLWKPKVHSRVDRIPVLVFFFWSQVKPAHSLLELLQVIIIYTCTPESPKRSSSLRISDWHFLFVSLIFQVCHILPNLILLYLINLTFGEECRPIPYYKLHYQNFPAFFYFILLKYKYFHQPVPNYTKPTYLFTYIGSMSILPFIFNNNNNNNRLKSWLCCEYLPINPRFSLWWHPVCYSRVVFTCVLPSGTTFIYTLSYSYLCTSVTVSDTYKRTNVLLTRHFINTIHKFNMFRLLKSHLLGV
jgi:hypothetical protein